MKWQQWTLAALVAATLSACANYSGMTTHGTMIDAATLGALPGVSATAEWPAQDWWTQYGDRQLDSLISEAMQASPTLAVARARLDRANALMTSADAARAPHVGLGGSATRTLYSNTDVFPPPLGGSYYNNGQLALDFGYEFDFWGKHSAQLQAAISQARAAEVEARSARLILAVSVARTYAQLARQYDLLDVAQATLAQREHLRQLTDARVKAGLDSMVEQKQAASSVPASRSEIADIRGQIVLLQDQLAALVGAGPARGQQIVRPVLAQKAPLAVPARLPAELLAQRPDIVAQRLRLEASSSSIDAAKAEFYPNVNLAGLDGFESVNISDLLKSASHTLSVGPAVHLPIFDGGRLRAGLSITQADYDIAVAQYNGLVIDAYRDVADQINAWRAIDLQQHEQQAAQRDIEDAYRIATLRYEQGLSNYLTVLIAETQVLAQRRLAVDLKARMLDTSIGLNRALGGGLALNPTIARAQ